MPRFPKPTRGRTVFRTVRASLGLVDSSSELFTVSQLLVVKNELEKALATINLQLKEELAGLFIENILWCFVTDPYLQEVRTQLSHCLTGGRRRMKTMSLANTYQTVSISPIPTPDVCLSRTAATEQQREDPRVLGFLSGTSLMGTDCSPSAADPYPCPVDQEMTSQVLG